MTEDLRTKILNGLEELLENRFGKYESAKVKIKNRHDYISIACPYCGDSDKVSTKKEELFTLIIINTSVLTVGHTSV